MAVRARLATQLPCPCWRCGKTILPTDRWVVGHVIDRAVDPSRTWDPANHRPEHHACNAKAGSQLGHARRALASMDIAARVTVVTGPPAAGKTTHIATHAQDQDLVIDLDAIARALMPRPPAHSHDYPEHIRHAAIGARAEAIRRATRIPGIHVWLIHAMPSPDQLAEYRRRNYTVVTIDPGERVVRDRCARLRPPAALRLVDDWYATTPALEPRPWA
jgi:hypothetical protein